MRILVNDELLDFTLEHENSVGEVLDGLSEWLSVGQFAITEIQIDGRYYPLHDRSQWAIIPVDQTDEIALQALPLNNIDEVILLALDQYMGLLIACLAAGETAAVPELAQELPFVRTRIYQFFPALRGTDNSETILWNPELEQGRMPGVESTGELIRQATQLRSILGSRLQEFTAPERELALTLGKLAASEAALTEVPVQLQIGETGDAMRAVAELTENLSRVLRMIPLVSSEDIDIEGIKSFAEEITPQLAELQDAFEAEDSVLVGDLLEYEIAPRLAGLATLVKEEIS